MNAFFSSCPRCGEDTLENLLTHTHCANCLFSNDERRLDAKMNIKAIYKVPMKLKGKTA